MIQIAELAYQASMLVWAVARLVLLPLLAVCGGLVLFHKPTLVWRHHPAAGFVARRTVINSDGLARPTTA